MKEILIEWSDVEVAISDWLKKRLAVPFDMDACSPAVKGEVDEDNQTDGIVVTLGSMGLPEEPG